MDWQITLVAAVSMFAGPPLLGALADYVRAPRRQPRPQGATIIAGPAQAIEY